MTYTHEQYKKETFAKHPELKKLYLEETLHYFLSEALKRKRKQKGISQSELAKNTGTTQSVVARVESGKGNISLKTLEKFLDELGLKLEVVEK